MRGTALGAEFLGAAAHRMPGARVIIGIPRTTPSTSMAATRCCTASTNSAAVDTCVHAPIVNLR